MGTTRELRVDGDAEQPRSDAELTGRSSTSVTVASPDADSRSRLTLPVAFSRTRTSSRPMNAALVGWASPLATVRTCRPGSTTDGGGGGGACCAVAVPVTTAVRTSGTAAVHHLLRRIEAPLPSRRTTVQPCRV